MNLLGIISILGTIGTFYFGWRALQLERAKTYYGWRKIESIARTLGKSAVREFKPELIVAVHGGGGIVAHLLMFQLDEAIPIRIAHLVSSGTPVPDVFREDVTVRRTTKFDIFVPKDLAKLSFLRVLLVDDCTVTGHSLSELRRGLIEIGFPETNIRTATAVCCRTAVTSKNAPDFSGAYNQQDEISFPWGAGQRLQRFGIVPSE